MMRVQKVNNISNPYIQPTLDYSGADQLWFVLHCTETCSMRKLCAVLNDT